MTNLFLSYAWIRSPPHPKSVVFCWTNLYQAIRCSFNAIIARLTSPRFNEPLTNFAFLTGYFSIVFQSPKFFNPITTSYSKFKTLRKKGFVILLPNILGGIYWVFLNSWVSVLFLQRFIEVRGPKIAFVKDPKKCRCALLLTLICNLKEHSFLAMSNIKALRGLLSSSSW